MISSFAATCRQERPQTALLACFVLLFYFVDLRKWEYDIKKSVNVPSGTVQTRIYTKGSLQVCLWSHKYCWHSWTAEDFWTKLHLLLSNATRIQHRKTANISSDLQSVSPACRHLGWHSSHLTSDANAVSGVSGALHGLSLPLVSWTAPWTPLTASIRIPLTTDAWS